MRVLVTGGSGAVGRWVVRELSAHGHSVVNADLHSPKDEPDTETPYRQVELTEVGQVAGAMHGCDAVVHLGAIPSPDRYPGEVVFARNTAATFSVLQAAMLLGVKRVVVASSTASLGMAFAPLPLAPLYVPIDETHPQRPHDPYGLSKEVDERIAASFARRTGAQVLAFRFHRVVQPGVAAHLVRDGRLSDDWQRRELGGYVDARDAATACRLGVEVTGLGFEVFNIVAADALSELPTAELVRRHHPDVPFRQMLAGFESAWSSDKARRLLGYAPRFSWREG